MGKTPVLYLLAIATALLFSVTMQAQVSQPGEDTFFLARKKGLLGKLGKSLVKSPEPEPPVKIVDPFRKYSGRIIRSVEIFPLGFNQSIEDTTVIKQNFAINLANRFHKNTRTSIIKNYLFFRQGDKLIPFLMSDNETFLRNQSFLNDALIIAVEDEHVNDSVDIVVLTRDVFSIGGNANIGSKNIRAELREENLGGSGSQVTVSGIYDMERRPRMGVGAEAIIRNIRGSFLNFSTGFNTFRSAFNSGRYEENSTYARLEKPLVNRYTQWTAALELAYNKTFNAYVSDSLYKSDYQYMYNNVDVWAGYNIGYKARKGLESDNRLRHFVAARVFYHKFDRLPAKYDSVYNYSYADINGVLFSYNLYKQNYYRTNYLYAFGRNEDVPTGLSASLIAGWTNKEDKRRPYYGIEFEANRFARKGIYSSYKLRIGANYRKGKFEDINFLASVDHFTKLVKISSRWRNRNFISFSFTKQLNFYLNGPLFLKSDFGFPYYGTGVVQGDQRTTIKLETDFYNLNKILGFRFAPFLFSDLCLVKPTGQPANKTDGFTALGGGLRARNENLVFGTIELKAFYFPRTIDGIKNWKVDLVTKVRFRFNDIFIRKPDFINPN